jgi:hypothetical protein
MKIRNGVEILLQHPAVARYPNPPAVVVNVVIDEVFQA